MMKKATGNRQRATGKGGVAVLCFLTAAWCLLPVASQAQTVTHRFNLSWTDNADNEQGFGVEQKAPGGAFEKIFEAVGADVTALSVDVTGPAGAEYCYRVYAFNEVGNSPYSNEVCGKIPAPLPAVPNAPSDLKISATTATSITLTWKDNSDNELGFNWFRTAMTGSGSSGSGTLPANTTTFTSGNLRRNTPYCFAVEAFNDGGTSVSNPSGVCGRTAK